MTIRNPNGGRMTPIVLGVDDDQKYREEDPSGHASLLRISSVLGLG